MDWMKKAQKLLEKKRKLWEESKKLNDELAECIMKLDSSESAKIVKEVLDIYEL